MPNTEIVRALVDAFNVNNYARDIIDTNFSLQSSARQDYIVVSFDKGMDHYQCRKYLKNIAREIVSEFYGVNEEETDEVVLNTAKLIFDVKSFPFDISKGEWSEEHGRVKFAIPVDDGIIFNLRSYLASLLKKDAIGDMPACRIVTKASDKKDYLWQGIFPNAELCKQFEITFLSSMRKRYKDIPDNLLKIKDNKAYIRDAFNSVCFIDSITKYTAWLTGMDLGVGNDVDYRVKLFKDMIIESIYQSAGVIVSGFICASPLYIKEASILIPIVQNDKGARLLTKDEARAINYAFNNAVLDNANNRTQGELLLNGSKGVYSINFSDPETSHCVINEIIRNSKIDKDHRLTIDFTPFTKLSHTQLRSPRQSSERGTGMLSQAELVHRNINSSNRSQQSIGAAAVGTDESVQGTSGGFSASFAESSDEYSKAESKENRAMGESPKKQHRGGVRCKQWRSKMLPKRFFNRGNNKPISRGDEGRYSTKSAPGGTANKKQPDPKQHNTFPARKGNLSSVPSPIRLKEGCSLEFPYLKYELVDGSTYVPKLTQEDIVEGKRRILYEFISYLPFKIDKEPEKRERLTFISSCSHKEIENLYFSFSSPDKRERLCPKLPFYHDKNKCQVESLWKEAHQSYAEKLSMLKVSERLKQSSGLVQNEPGCRDSIASKSSEASKDSAYFTGSPASQRSSTSNILGSSYEGESLHSFPSCTSFLSEPSTSGSVLRGTSRYNPDSSDEDKFSDKSLRHGSSVSGLSTSSSVLRDTSKCSSDSSDEDKFFRRPSEYISRINKSPTGSSISSNKSSETIVEHDTENKGAFRENSPSSQVGLIQLLRAKPSAEHRKFLENLKQQHAKGKNRIDRILGLGKMGLSETRGGVHSRFS